MYKAIILSFHIRVKQSLTAREPQISRMYRNKMVGEGLALKEIK
jgi:hypothetical protein